MYRSIVICSILCALFATTFSRNTGLVNHKDVQNTPRIVTSTPEERKKSESASHGKRSLVILLPKTKDRDELEYQDQKAKRWSASARREIFSTPLSKNRDQTISRSRIAENLRNIKRRAQNSPVSSKKPNISIKSEAMRKKKDVSSRDEDLFESIRKQLPPDNPNVGASRGISEPEIHAVEDDNFVCYCKAKPPSTVGVGRNTDSKLPASTKRNRVEKKYDDKKALVGSKHLKNTLYDGLHSFNPYPDNLYPAMQHGGQKTIPFVPYIYNVDPRLAMLPNAFPEKVPPKINVPLNPVDSRPDTIVGEHAPSSQRKKCNKKEQTVGTPSTPRNMVGNSPTRCSKKTTPSVPLETIAAESASSYTTNTEPTDKNDSEPEETTESLTEAPIVGLGNPESDDESFTESVNEVLNNFETTESGSSDYFDANEVGSSDPTSKAYEDTSVRGPSGFDESRTIGDELADADPEDNGYNDVNLQSRSNGPTENSVAPAKAGGNVETLSDVYPDYPSPVEISDRTDKGDESNLYSNPEENANDDLNQNVGSVIGGTDEDGDDQELEEPYLVGETTELIVTDLTAPDKSGPSAEIDDKDPLLGKEFSVEDYATESPDTEDNTGPLRSDYDRENFGCDKSEQKIDCDQEKERRLVGASSTEAAVYYDDSESDYTTISEDLVNTDNERVGARHETTIRNESEDYTSTAETSLESSIGDETVDTKNPSDQSLPFCDNTLLEKSIKAVINNFATGDSSEMNEETVGSSMGEDLLPEIVNVPNLKGILSMTPIEHTILDKIKNLLSKITGVQRQNFDSDWATKMIRNSLRHTLSAAPKDNTELPPMTVEERQFKNGEWVTNLVTLEPSSNEEPRQLSTIEKSEAQIKSLLRDPAMSLQAAKNPAVQNMIVQSVRKTFEQGDAPSNETLDYSLIESTLNNELSIMEMEMENAQTETMEDEYETTTFDTSNMDVDMFLDIARAQAGVSEEEENETATERDLILSTGQSLDYDLIGATRNLDLSEATEVPDEVGNRELEPTPPGFEKLPEGPKCETAGISDYNCVKHDPSTIGSIESTDTADKGEVENGEQLVGMENTELTQKSREHDTPAANDFAYLGKISIKNKDNTDDVRSLQNSELFYIGDGVQLPLEIRKLDAGTYALTISRKICEYLLNKDCPCCVPPEGNVVRSVIRNSETKNADGTLETNEGKSISKRESSKSILPNQRGKCDSADDSLQILSMPVESFARRYNLSLNLGKVQSSWNFDKMGKIDGRSRERLQNEKSKEENNDGTDLLRNSLLNPISENKRRTTIRKEYDPATSYEYQMQQQRNLDKYRYQRNVNQDTNKRAKIVESVLNWLKDIILNIRTA